MPTAAKLEKQSSNDMMDTNKLITNLFEKKLRNLEKRKTRLQELKEFEAKGQKLENEQLAAVRKLDQVIEMIDMLKDLNKNLTDILVESAKQSKKLAKKEQLDRQVERQGQEVERLKTILQFQDVLGRFESNVTEDFRKGTNGAVKLTDDELSQLDKLYVITSELTETSAEKLISLADGKTREAWTGVTFHQLKELMMKIINTKYFKTEPTIPTISNKTTVTAVKGDEQKKQFVKESETNTTKPNSNQFQTIVNNDVIINQLQSQLSSGISFMRDASDDIQRKDPAVVAVNQIPNYPYQYGVQTNEQLGQQMSNSIPNSSAINSQQKVTNFETVSSMSSIPTQTFTNQSFAAMMPNIVPVTSAIVHQGIPIQGVVAQDMTQHQIPIELGVGQNYQNHQNFMDSHQDKQQITSQDRSVSFQSEDRNGHRNRGGRGSRGTNPGNINGYGNRPKNGSKGSGAYPPGNSYGYQNNGMNGSNYGNNTYERGQNNRDNRGRQQTNPNRGNRTERAPNRTNFNNNNPKQ